MKEIVKEIKKTRFPMEVLFMIDILNGVNKQVPYSSDFFDLDYVNTNFFTISEESEQIKLIKPNILDIYRLLSKGISRDADIWGILKGYIKMSIDYSRYNGYVIIW